MADDDVNGDSDEAQKIEGSQKKTAKHDSGAADLEKVTDYAEEKEISSSDDFSELKFIGDKRTKEVADKLAREKELAKVSIKKEDVDLIVRELEISRTVAERSLREHQGNLVNALAALTHENLLIHIEDSNNKNVSLKHPRKINCSCTKIPNSPDSSISESVHFSINAPQPECQHFTLNKVDSTENIDKRLYPSVKILDADNSSLSDTSCGCDSPCKPSNSAKRTCHCNQQLLNYGYFNGCHSCGPSAPYTYSTQQHYEFDYQNFHQNTYEYQQFNVQKVTANISNDLSVNVRSWSDSSINICEDRTTSIDLPPLNWNGYDCDPSCLTAAHTGKTLLINGNWCSSRPYIQGGPLNGTYIFSQIHFHSPSEHSLEGKRFPLEMHVVHYKTNYLTQERAMKEKDGTLVLVYLFEVSDCCEKTSFACITEVAQCLIKAHSTKDIPPMSLNNLMCPFYSNYYFYMGTVGAHKETYLLQVVVNCKVSEIPRNELKELLSILKSGSGSAHHLSKMRPQNDSIFHVGAEAEDVCASTSKPATSQCSKTSVIQETICSRPNAHNPKRSQRRHRFRFNTVSAPSVCQSLDENFSQTSMSRRRTSREEYRERREELRRERKEENKRRKCLKRMTKMENRCRRQLRKREGFLGCKTKPKRQECLRYYIKTKKLQQRCSQHSKLGECTESCVKREIMRRQDDPTRSSRRDDCGKEVVWKNSTEGCDLVVVESTISRNECDEDSASASTSQKQSADESSQDNDFHKGSIDKTRSITESRRSVDKTVSIDSGRKLNYDVPKRDVKGSIERCTETVCVRKKSNEDCCEGDFVRDILMDDDELEDEDFLTNPIFQDCVKAQMCRRRRARKKWRTKCSLCKTRRCRDKHCCTQKIEPNDPIRATAAPPFVPAEKKIIDKKEEGKKNVDRRDTEKRESDRMDLDKRESLRRDTENRESDRTDLDKRESLRRDTEKRESDRTDLDKRESIRRDTEKREPGRTDLDKRESLRRDTEKRESDRTDLDKRESFRRDSEKRESDRTDLDKKDLDRRESEKCEAEKKEAAIREMERREAEKKRKQAEKKEAEKREAERREAERRYFEKVEADRLLAERREFDRKEYELREAQRKAAERKKAEKMEAQKKKAEKPKDKRSFWNFDIFRRSDKNKERSKSQDTSNKKQVKTVSIMPAKEPQHVEKKVEPKKPTKVDDDVFALDDKNDVIVHYMMSPNEQKEKFSNENVKIDKNLSPTLGESSSSQSSFKKYETPPESLLGDPLKPPSKENHVTFNINLESDSKPKRDANIPKPKTELHPNKLLNKKDATFRNSFPPYFADSFGSSNKNILPTFTVTSKSNFIKESLVEKPPLISTGTQCSVNKIFCKRTSLAEKIASNREKGLLKTEFEDKKECYIKLIKNPELKESLKQKDIDKLEETTINKTEADSPKSKKKRKYFVVDKIEKDHKTGKKILVGCFRTKEELIVIKEMAKERINRKEMDAQREKELERKESLCEREICIKKFDIEKKKSTDRKENILSKQPSLKKVVVERKKSLEDKEDFRKREFILKNLDEQKIGILIKKECYGNKSDAIRNKRLERKESIEKSISSIRTVDVEKKESAPKKTVSWKSVAVDKKRSFGIRDNSVEKESRLKKSESEQKKSLRHRDPSVKTADIEKRKRGDKRDFSLKRLDPEKKESLVKRTDSGRKESSGKREYSLKRVDSDKRKEIKVIKSPKVEEVPKKSVVKSTDIAFRKDDLEKKKGGIKVENVNKKEDFCPFEKRKSLGKRDSSVKRTDAENKKNIDKKDELSKRGEVAKMKDGEKKKSLIKRENSLKRKNSNKKTNVEEEKNTEAKESKQNDKTKTKGKKKLFNAEVSEDKEKDKTTHKKRNGDKTENIDLVKKYSDFDEEEENIANLDQILGAEKKEQIKSESSKETKICFERNQDFDEKEHLEILEYLKNQIEKADSTEMGKELDQNEIIEICEETERKTNFKKEECTKESKFKNSKTRISMADLKSIEKIIELSKNENIKAEEKTESENLAAKCKTIERKDLENEDLVTTLEREGLEKANLASGTKIAERKEREKENLTTKSKNTERKELGKENFATTNKSIERKGLEKDNLATECKNTEIRESEKENFASQSKSTENKELEKENFATKSKSTERKEFGEENLVTKSNSTERKESEKENIALKSKTTEKKEQEKENLATESKSTERKKLDNENLDIKGRSTEIKELEKNNFATKSMAKKELEKDNLVTAINSSECKEIEKEYLATASKCTEKKEVEKENYFKEYENIKYEDDPNRKETSNYSDDSDNEEDLYEARNVGNIVDVKEKSMNKINDFVTAQNSKSGYVKNKVDQDKVTNTESKERMENKKVKSSKDLEGKNVVVKKSQNLIHREEIKMEKKNLSEREVNENSNELCSKKSVKDDEGIGKKDELQNRISKTDERKEMNITYKNLDKKQALSTTKSTDKKCDLDEKADIGKSENSRTTNDLDDEKNINNDIKIFVEKKVNEEQNNLNQSTKLNSVEGKEKTECFGSTQGIKKEKNAECKAEEEEVRYISIHKKNDEEINEEEPAVAKFTKEEVVKEKVIKEDLDNVGSKKEEKNLKKKNEVELKLNKTQKADLEETAKTEKESEKSDCCVNSLFRAQIPSTSVSETSQTPQKCFSIKVLKPQKLISDLSQDSLDESFTKRSSCVSKMSMFHQEDLEKKNTNAKKEISISNTNKGTFEAEKDSGTTLESKDNDEKDQQSLKHKSLENSEKDSYFNKSSLGESLDKEVRVLHKFRPKEKMKKAKAERKEQIVEKVLEKIKNSEVDHPNLGEILGINKDNPKISVCEMEISDHSEASSTTKEISQNEQSSKQFSAKNSVYSPQILDSKETSKTKLGLPFEKVDSQAAIIIIPIEVNSLSNIELLVVEKIKQSLQSVEKKEVKQSEETSENVIEKRSAEFVPQDAANESEKEEKEKSKEKEELNNGREGGSVKNCVVAPQTPQNNEPDVNEVDLENEYKFESNSYNRSLFEFPLFLLIFNSHSSNFLNFSHIYSSFLRLPTIF